MIVSNIDTTDRVSSATHKLAICAAIVLVQISGCGERRRRGGIGAKETVETVETVKGVKWEEVEDELVVVVEEVEVVVASIEQATDASMAIDGDVVLCKLLLSTSTR